MKLGGYIKRFGDKDFNQLAFNDVDGLLLSFLSYANWEKYAPSLDNPDGRPFAFKSIRENKINPLVEHIPTRKAIKKLLYLVSKSKRFKNCKVKYIENKIDFDKKQVYFALTYEVPNVGNYVCFRGTDLSILAWEENLIQCLDIVTQSQSDSLDYLKKVGNYIKGNFYVGGHSKGGNLAIYSSMKANKTLQNRIIKIHSFDGTGFYSSDFYNLESYKRIEDRILQIIPTDSFVGVLFYTPKKYRIVSSSALSVIQHFPSTWRINKKSGVLVYKKRRSFMSFVRHRAIRKWVDNATNDTKALAVEAIVTALGGNDKDLTFFFKHPGLIGKTVIAWRKRFTKEERKIIYRFSGQLVKCYFSSFFFCLKKSNRKAEE